MIAALLWKQPLELLQSPLSSHLGQRCFFLEFSSVARYGISPRLLLAGRPPLAVVQLLVHVTVKMGLSVSVNDVVVCEVRD